MNASAVSYILKEGTIIGTRLGSSGPWQYNIVYKCQEDMVMVSLVNSYLENMITIGSSFTLKYATEYFEYVFEGVVSDICLNYPAYAVIHVTGGEELVYTRLFPRYYTQLAAVLQPQWEDTPVFCVTANISLGGMAFIASHIFDQGDEASVHIHITPGNIVYANGRITRKCITDGSCDCSMQFTGMDEANSNRLSAYLYSIEKACRNMQSDFYNNIIKCLK